MISNKEQSNNKIHTFVYTQEKILHLQSRTHPIKFTTKNQIFQHLRRAFFFIAHCLVQIFQHPLHSSMFLATRQSMIQAPLLVVAADLNCQERKRKNAEMIGERQWWWNKRNYWVLIGYSKTIDFYNPKVDQSLSNGSYSFLPKKKKKTMSPTVGDLFRSSTRDGALKIILKLLRNHNYLPQQMKTLASF